MKKSEPAMVYQIKVTLNSISPPIWRRILVADKITLLDLHAVIQDVFGWLDYHLHEFTIHGVGYGDPANDEFGDFTIKDETKYKLRKLDLAEGSRFSYKYDFGDSWEHTLIVEKILPYEKGMKLPQCIKGKRARPPEDVGGPWGYQGFLEAIRDPQNEEYESYLEWSGGDFNPEAFDLEAVNKRLQQQAERNWTGNTPPSVEDTEEPYKFLFDTNRLVKLLSIEDDQAAKTLALRQDVVTFLTYLKENKVTGTQSTGNLPRKVIEDITPRFVNPPILETTIGDIVLRYHNEDDVWPLYFVHVLAQAADLISGGPSRLWRLTPASEIFLTLPAVVQVWILLAAWWYRVNWMVAYSFDIFGGELPDQFSQTVSSHLRALAVDQNILFESFADQVIQAMGWARPPLDTDHYRTAFRAAIQYMVIDPLEKFGVLTTLREKDNSRFRDVQILVSFSLTRLGSVLLESLLA
jgi:hypothetical protein